MDDRTDTGAQAERIRQFSTDIAALGGRDPVARRERILLRGGAAVMVVGLGVAAMAYSMSHGTTNELQQRDAIVLALLGTTATLAGGIVFLRYSLGRLLRLWLARLLWVQDGRGEAFLNTQEPEATSNGAPGPCDLQPITAEGRTTAHPLTDLPS